MSTRRSLIAATLANGLTSVGNFALTVALARSVDAQTFGSFAMVLLVATLIVGILRASVLESAVTKSGGLTVVAGGVRELLWPVTTSAVGLLVLGLILDRNEIVFLGVALPGLCAFDYTRNAMLVSRKAVLVMTMEFLWTASTLVAATLCIMQVLSPMAAFGVWSISPGLIIVLFGRYWFFAAVRHRERWLSWVFGADYLVGTGAMQLSTVALGGIGSPAMVGAIRAGGTLLSPINLITSAVRPILIAYVARGDGQSIRGASRIAVALAVVGSLGSLAILSIPDSLGYELLGESWPGASQVRLPLAFEAVLGMIAGVALAGQRALVPGRQVLKTRLGLAVVRLLVMSACTVLWGLMGAVWSLSAVTLIGCVAWWYGYVRAERGGPHALTAST